MWSLCNNHALDQGLGGLRRTRQLIRQRGGAVVGGLHSDDALEVVAHRNRKVVIVGSSYGINPWSHGLSESSYPPGIPLLRFGSDRRSTDWRAIEASMARVRSLRPDLVVFMPHWGFEFEYFPDRALRQAAHRLIALGVDVILGTSPHVVQPLEIVSVNGWDLACPVQISRPETPSGGRPTTRRSTPRPAIIAYSQGNFTTSMPTLACNTGMLLSLDLVFGSNGDLVLREVEAAPTVSVRRSGRRRVTQAWSECRTEAWAQPFGQHFERVTGLPVR